MKQIRVNKIPIDYFVSNIPYPSGNYKFDVSTWGMDGEGNKWIKDDYKTKHIQLIAANPSIFQREQLLDGVLTPDNMKKLMSDKDVFLYEVSKEK